MCVIVTRLIVLTFALYFTRSKIISRIKSNIFCICVYNESYYTLIHRIIDVFFCLSTFLVCRLDKLLSWFSTQTSVVNFRYYLFCLCNVRRQYLLPGILGIYCFLTGVPSLPAIALPKGQICSLVNQVYTSFPLMSLPPFGLH